MFVIVAITGGTGFIGRHLMARHAARGDQVRYLTRRKAVEGIHGAIAYVGSLNSSLNDLRRFVSGVDVLYHCAAELRDEAEMHKTNVLGTANLIAAAGGHIGRWVQLSSTGIYGNGRYGDIREETGINPGNAYERSKSESDQLVFAAAEKQNLQCVVLRPSNVYGTDMPNQSLFQLIRVIDKGVFFFIGAYGAVANYIHVENVVDALVLCGTAELPVNGRVYIVSDHRTLEDFVGIIAASLGKKKPQKRMPESLARFAVALNAFFPGFPLTPSRLNALTNRTVYRTNRIESELGYKNKISMEEGIGELVRSWKMNQTKAPSSKLKVARVVTAPFVVPWHMANTLKRMPADFEVCVVGQDVSSYRVSYPGVRWVDIDIDRKINLVWDLFALYALCRFFISYKPDIVHSIMPKAGLVAAIAGFICRVPVRIHTFTGQVWATMTGPSRLLYYWLDRLINALNTICLTDSPSQSAFLHAHKISSKGKPLPVLSKGSLSGVDVEKFNSAALTEQAVHLRTQLGLNETDFVFAFIGRKTRDKGAVDMLRAFTAVSGNYRNARLLFVGPDESGGEIERLTQSDPEIFNNVLDVGPVENHELYLAISNVLCLPSHREGFGTIVIDAAALGLPAIGSNIPGLIDAIEDGKTGVLFPAGDIRTLAGIMTDCLENPDKYVEMGRKAKARVIQFFSADALYDSLKALYLELVGSRTRVEMNKNGK